MILPIYLYGQPVLRKPTEDITPESLDLKQLLSDMWETLAVAEGCGLAADLLAIHLALVASDVPGSLHPPRRARCRGRVAPPRLGEE